MIQNLNEQIEEANSPVIEESSYSSGVLNIELRGKKFYVLNKQTPNKQIWLSSPVSGPSRFEHDPNNDKWSHYRTTEDLLDLLNREFQDAATNQAERLNLKYNKNL